MFLLQNTALSAQDPVPPSRVLAKYLAQTGRCRAALLEYKRLAKYIQLSEEEQGLIAGCEGGGNE